MNNSKKTNMQHVVPTSTSPENQFEDSPVTPRSITSEMLPSPSDLLSDHEEDEIDTLKIAKNHSAPMSPAGHTLEKTPSFSKHDDEDKSTPGDAPSPKQANESYTLTAPPLQKLDKSDMIESKALSQSQQVDSSEVRDELLGEVVKRDEIIGNLNDEVHRFQQILTAQRQEMRSIKAHLVRSLKAQEHLETKVESLQNLCNNMRKEHERSKATLQSTIDNAINERLRQELQDFKQSFQSSPRKSPRHHQTSPPPSSARKSSTPLRHKDAYISRTPRGKSTKRPKVTSYQSHLDSNNDWLDRRTGQRVSQSARGKRDVKDFENYTMSTADIITRSYDRLSKKQKDLSTRSKSPFYEYRGGGYTPKSMSRNRISSLSPIRVNYDTIIGGEYKVRRGSSYDELLTRMNSPSPTKKTRKTKSSPSQNAPSPRRKKTIKKVPTAQPNYDSKKE
mmetsp:Transcript_4394/g.6469  ORF Transcript_4394/g.6469 Transcript_4394/m.6469 type:complete len:448 (+) Transcript_4394:164-1507(+)